ncbi:MAG: cyclically-permuted mutarotase family protein [Phocaeicola sp.]
MKRTAITATIAFACCSLTQCVIPSQEEMKATPLAPLPIGSSTTVKGVSAPFAIAYNHSMWVAGGCNFPNQPAAEGGSKVYYDAIYSYSDSIGKWEYKGNLPIPLAYGASVLYNNQWICVGGNNEQHSSAAVLSIALNKVPLRVDTLPSLPITMDNTAAVCSKNFLYVAGGICNGKPGTQFYRLNLEQPEAWEELINYPEPARVQLQLACGENEEILLLGGFNGGTVNQKPEMPEEVWSYCPQNKSWKEVAKLPICTTDNSTLALVGGFAIPQNDSLLLVGGGVNRPRFEEALLNGQNMLIAKQANNQEAIDSIAHVQRCYLLQPIAWYNFNPEIFVFNVKRSQWVDSFSSPQAARAGAGVGIIGESLYVIGGELKPGIRTDEANKMVYLVK